MSTHEQQLVETLTRARRNLRGGAILVLLLAGLAVCDMVRAQAAGTPHVLAGAILLALVGAAGAVGLLLWREWGRFTLAVGCILGLGVCALATLVRARLLLVAPRELLELLGPQAFALMLALMFGPPALAIAFQLCLLRLLVSREARRLTAAGGDVGRTLALAGGAGEGPRVKRGHFRNPGRRRKPSGYCEK